VRLAELKQAEAAEARKNTDDDAQAKAAEAERQRLAMLKQEEDHRRAEAEAATDAAKGGPWVWVYCPRWACLHRAPMALTPAIIRWGPDACSDVQRERTRCSMCGHRGGVTIQGPSRGGPHIRFARFPAEELSRNRR
jgi:hypothetical protein